jgi:hypothetical protein
VLNATTDVWIRESDPNSQHEDDLVSVWGRGEVGEGPYRRFGAVEFDLSGITAQITGAHLELYAIDNRHNDTAFDQQAFLLGAHGIGTLTWNTAWATPYHPWTALDSLGWYDIPADQPKSTWYDSSAASANDLVLLEALRTSAEKKVTMLLADGNVGTGQREWGDAGYAGAAPRLVITTIPEPSALLLCVTGLFGALAYGWRKRK